MNFEWETKGVVDKWQSPDGKITIYTVINDEAKTMKTMSSKIATVGFKGTVEQYTNQKGNTYIRQPAREGFIPNDTSLGNSGKTPAALADPLDTAWKASVDLKLQNIEQKLDRLIALQKARSPIEKAVLEEPLQEDPFEGLE